VWGYFSYFSQVQISPWGRAVWPPVLVVFLSWLPLASSSVRFPPQPPAEKNSLQLREISYDR